MEPHQLCRFDHLTIESTSDEEDKEVLCGTVIPSPIIVRSDQTRVTFISDESVTERGFYITFSAETPDCE